MYVCYLCMYKIVKIVVLGVQRRNKGFLVKIYLCLQCGFYYVDI